MTSGAASGPGRSRWRGVLGVLTVALFVAYPVVVWFGLQHRNPRSVALILLAVIVPLAILRLRGSAREIRRFAILPVCTVLALTAGAWLNDVGYVLAVPVVISVLLLAAFGTTLRPGAMPMIERFARMQVSELNSEQLAWCRSWTWIWCGFFVANGVTAALLAAGDLEWWTLYTGALSYLLVALLLASEWVLRRRRFGSA